MSAATFSSSRATSSQSGSAMFQQLMLPLQSVVNFFSPPAPTPSFTRASVPVSASPQPIRHSMVGRSANAPVNLSANQSAAQILRSRRAQDGRIVISGRMRDVCAELDRLCSDPA
jgi:hypothetical protein